jgi:glucose uptake protein GlcU
MGYFASAIANLACYGMMMIISFWLGNKYYPVPYQWKKSLGYLVLAYLFYLLHHVMRSQSTDLMNVHLFGIGLLLCFVVIILRTEKEEFKKIPYLNKIYAEK